MYINNLVYYFLVIEMRNAIILGILGFLLLFGCAAPPEIPPTEPVVEEEPTAPPPGVSVEPIQVSGDESLQVIKINMVNGAFPLQLYDEEFESVGIYSDSFIQLNNSHIMFLGEGEAIWLTPMVEEGKGVLFNAIYSNTVSACNVSRLTILEKDYDVSALKNGSSFENDDKWKVALEKENGCLKRAIIYMDGYFYDLEDNDQISLFRNDNTLLFQFTGLESQPQIHLVATKPLK